MKITIDYTRCVQRLGTRTKMSPRDLRLLTKAGFIWRHSQSSEGLIVPLTLSSNILNYKSGAITGSEARDLVNYATSLPGFRGTVYAMSDRKRPGYVKIGKAKHAFHRMAQSRSDAALGHIKKTDRLEHLVLLCFDVSQSTVETKLHDFHKEKRIDIGHGREWFEIDYSEILKSLKILAPDPSTVCMVDGHPNDSVRDQIKQVLYASQSSDHAMLADLGKMKFIQRSAKTMKVYFSLWCPVEYEKIGTLPISFFRPPLEATEAQIVLFEEDIRQLATPDDRDVLDAYEKGNNLYPLHDDQRIDRFEEVGALSNDDAWSPEMKLNEWVIDNLIYDVDFSVRLDIFDTFDIRSDGRTVLRERAVLS